MSRRPGRMRRPGRFHLRRRTVHLPGSGAPGSRDYCQEETHLSVYERNVHSETSARISADIPVVLQCALGWIGKDSRSLCRARRGLQRSHRGYPGREASRLSRLHQSHDFPANRPSGNSGTVQIPHDAWRRRFHDFAAYSYAAVQTKEIFMPRTETRQKFQQARNLLSEFKLMTSPIYLEFLSGERDMMCTAWGNPTFNPRGWKGPCYLMTDAHHATFKDLIEKTPWEKYGHGRDPRCQDCMVHAGYEPSAVLGANRKFGDSWKLLKWQLSNP